MAEIGNSSVIEQLEKLGLSKHEALIYLSVLKHGEASAGVILDEVKLHREQVYRGLKRLTDQGLVTSYQKRKRSYYSPLDPQVFISQAKTKLTLAESLQSFLNKLYQSKPQVIKVWEGEESIKLQLEDMLQTIKPGGEYLIIGGVGEQFYNLSQKYGDYYSKRFLKKNIKGRIIIYEGSIYPKESPYGENLAVKTLKRPPSTPASTVIYGNKVVIGLLEEGNIANIVIENENIANSYRETFEALWG